MQEREKERGRRRERWDAVCGREEGRVAGGGTVDHRIVF